MVLDRIIKWTVLLQVIGHVSAFSQSASFSLSDRFKATCPADKSAIMQFDPSLLNNSDDDSCTWVAIYRSSNNMPSVLIKDDFLNAMRIATSVQTDGNSPSTAMDESSFESQIENKSGGDDSGKRSGVQARTPVAVAKLAPSSMFPDKWVIESMRCSLKKEDTNEVCDGGSEHTEAISICIDELLLHHLKEGRSFDKGIRTKATIYQGNLLEDRGFEEVTKIEADMATHVSNLDASVIKYAERAVETLSKSPGARDRALKILNYLGKQEPVEEEPAQCNDGEDTDNDPWANVKW